MPLEVVETFTIRRLQILAPDGSLDEDLARNTLSDEQVVALYRHMTTCRQLDEIAFKLQRSGRMGTYPQNKGQEAIAAVGLVARKEDWMVPCYRENAALFLHGLPMEKILLHWMGDERGNQIPEGLRQTPMSIPIGTHMLHAAGIGWAARLKGEDSVAFTFFGDGATSEGDFHEAMNFATVMRAQTVFICQNNQWAISVPRARQTRSQTIAQKALAYGARCLQVDGNDIFAIYKAAKEAHERARQGEVTLIETLTYRLGDHTTADDARRYRDPREVEAWLEKDPLLRTRRYLERKGLWSDEQQRQLEQEAKETVDAVVERAMHIAKPSTDDIFDHTFATLPSELETQKRTLRTASLAQKPQQETLSRAPQAAIANGQIN
ncbi:MAG: pyruvate dehydrogenase (acetyl-transferring) E1 component subunit alpha [Planctomycetota bacterium]|nr:MAG: pyruvate dehydrogenase (acetyl-transferring) E1 component subunit alpha [Planctomycetota bacterium]